MTNHAFEDSQQIKLSVGSDVCVFGRADLVDPVRHGDFYFHDEVQAKAVRDALCDRFGIPAPAGERAREEIKKSYQKDLDRLHCLHIQDREVRKLVTKLNEVID